MSFIIVVSVLFYSATESAPPETYGTLAADDFSKNLATMNQNIYNGVTSLSSPLSKLAIDTAPDLAHLYAIFNGVNVPPAVAALAKDLYRNIAVGGGKLAGDAAVLGSTVLGSTMKVGGHGLQAGNNAINAAGESMTNLAGKVGDYAATGTTVGTDILASGLNTMGDGMLAGSVGMGIVSQGIADVTDAIGGRLTAAIASAEKTAAQLLDSRVKKLESGLLEFADKRQERAYEALVAYTQILIHIQNLLHQFASAIAGGMSVTSVAQLPV